MAGGTLQSLKRTLPFLTTLSQNGTHACIAHPDGNLQLFQLPSARRLTPPTPLPARGGRPSALALPPDLSLVASGTDAGHLLLDGRSVAILDGAPVADILLQDGTLLAAGGTARELIVVDVKTSAVSARFSFAKDHRSPISALAANIQARQAVVCSQAVTLVDFDTGKTLRKYTGHASPVSAATMFPTRTRFVTGCNADRFLFVWDAALDADAAARGKKRRKFSTYKPLHTLIAPVENVRSIAVDEHETTGTSVAAVLATGAVAVWRNWTEKGSSSPTACSFVIHPAPMSHPRPPAVFLASFSKVGVVTVLYGSSLKPEAHSVSLNAQEAGETFLPVVHENGLLVKSEKNSVSVMQNSRVKKTSIQPTKLVGLPVAPEPDKAKNGVLASADTVMEDSSADDDSEDEEDSEKDVEPTLQEKLQALGVGNDDTASAGVKLRGRVGPVKLDSRVSVILQAVRSKDSQMLEKCIMNGASKSVIKSTVQRIPSAVAAGDLLDILVGKLQRYPGKADRLVPWVKEILIEHASALMGERKSVTLTSLVAIVNTRMQSLDALSRLEGRLELVVGQAARLKREGIRSTTGNAQARAEYVEEEGEEEEDSSESESQEDSDEGEGATGDSSDSEESSSDSEDKEDMEVDARHSTMNGKKGSEEESSSDESSEEDGD